MEVETSSLSSCDVNNRNFPALYCRNCPDFPISSTPPASDEPLKPLEVEEGQVCENGDGGGVLERCPSDAAMKVQKFYRGYRTRRKLADSAVVAEELWWQVLDFARLSHSTISFFNFSKPETAASRWNRVSLNASKVGKGLSEDSRAQKLAFQHWIEAIDPRHRYGHGLHYYFIEWCNAGSGQPFFYWLDIGDGKDLDLKDWPRSKLQQCIKYLGPNEREHYEYIVVDGKLSHKLSGKPLDTKHGSPDSKWIFVLSTCKRLYVGKKEKGFFHHSSFLAGGATLASGRLDVEDGVLKCISAYSGHYRPTDESLDGFSSFLKENGVNLDEVEIIRATEEYDEGGRPSFDEPAAAADSKDSAPCDPPGANGGSEPGPEPEPEAKYYKRSLSGGLQSPKAEVPKKAIMQRINSKKAVKSYQLGHQLSTKWSTGAGPRISCVADYPLELRLQALEFTNLSPRPAPAPVAETATETETRKSDLPTRFPLAGAFRSCVMVMWSGVMVMCVFVLIYLFK